MPEYLVTYRDNNTGHMFNVHIYNVDTEHDAIQLANNSLLDDIDPTYMFSRQLSESEHQSDPFID